MVPSSPPAKRTLHLLLPPDISSANDNRFSAGWKVDTNGPIIATPAIQPTHDAGSSVLKAGSHVPIPVLKQFTAQNETFVGVTYHIEGETVPVLHLELSDVPVYFEHYILLWKDLQVQISIRPLKGAFKRMLAGMPVFLTQVSGPGQIGFSRDGAGHLFAIHLNRGEGIDMREHQFLAATGNMTIRSVASKAFPTCCWPAQAFSSAILSRRIAKASFGCMDTGTSL